MTPILPDGCRSGRPVVGATTWQPAVDERLAANYWNNGYFMVYPTKQ
jgi:hypothetical protein